MDLAQLANLGEFIGGVAVLATLIYLAIQVRQNTKAVASNTQTGLFETWSALSSNVIQDPAVAELLVAAQDDSTAFSPADQVRFEWLAVRLFGQWENAYAQFLEGIFDPKHWTAYDALYRDWLDGYRFRAHWKSHKHWYFSDFVTYVDECLLSADRE